MQLSIIKSWIVIIGFALAVAAMLISFKAQVAEIDIEEGVIVSSVFVSKVVVVTDDNLGNVSDIKYTTHQNPESSMTVAGTKGVVFINRQGKKIAPSVLFLLNNQHIKIVDVDGDDKPEYLNLGGAWQAVSLSDSMGRPRWVYPAKDSPIGTTVNSLSYGDLDRDGVYDFVVGMNAGDGLHLLDQQGRQTLAAEDTNVWHVEIIDGLKDTEPIIVHSNASGDIVIRSTTAKYLKTLTTPTYVSKFSLVKWAAEPKGTHLIFGSLEDKNDFYLMKTTGEVVANFKVPSIPGHYGSVNGAWFNDEDGQSQYFGLLVESTVKNSKSDRLNFYSTFYAYNINEKLVYQEVFNEKCKYIGEDKIAPTHRLLIGCNKKLLGYHFK
jgi:hypothetical protein